MPINLGLLGHIILDSESQSRFGIEGNLFRNTFAYLHEFLQTEAGKLAIAETEKAHLTEFTRMIPGIIEIERDLNEASLDDLSTRILHQMKALKNDESQLFPGGWANQGENGHAMIYAFERDESGKLLFHIYNSGAGISHHAKLSTPVKETYSPKKTFAFPEPVNEELMHGFVKKLLANQIPVSAERMAPYIKADSLYHGIATQMQLLGASEQLITFIPENIEQATTAGQISGTCSQRSIHQLLKLNFSDLNHYKFFMFHFKMHALTEYLDTPPKQYSREVADFLLKAVKHNAKMLSAMNLDSHLKTAHKQELERFVTIIHSRTSEHAEDVLAEMPPGGLNLAASSLSPQPTPSIIVPSPPIQPIRLGAVHRANSPQFDKIDITANGKISAEKLKNRITKIENQYDASIRLNLFSELIRQLPIPETSSYAQSIDASNPTELQAIVSAVQRLIIAYKESHNQKFGAQTSPKEMIDLLSLLSVYLEIFKTINPWASDKIQDITFYIDSLIKKINASALKVSYDPDLDQRLKALTFLYSSPKTQPTRSFLDHWVLQLKANPLWQELIDSQYNPENPAHIKAKQCGYLGLQILKEQFQDINLSNRSSFPYFNTLADKPESLKNCIIATSDGMYWIPQYGEPVEIDSIIDFFSAKYRILKPDSPLLNERYRAIFLDFQSNLDLETVVYSSISPTINVQKADLRAHILRFAPVMKGFEEDGPLAKRDEFYLTDSYFEKNFQITRPEVKNALSPPHPYLNTNSTYIYNSSSIQLDHLKNTVQASYERILIRRELYHLRTNLDTSAIHSLGYFSSHLDSLKDPELQRYLEINLFQTPEKINMEQFEQFIQDGLKLFNDSEGNITPNSIYFILLKAKLYVYLSASNSHYHEILITWLEMSSSLTANPEFKHLLNLIKFKALMQKTTKTEAEEIELYQSFISIKAQRLYSPYLTPIELHQLQDLSLSYQMQAGKPPAPILVPIVVQHLEKIGIDLSSYKNPPIISGQEIIFEPKQEGHSSLHFHMQLAKISTDEGIIGPIPEFFYQHPLFKSLNLDPNALVIQNVSGNFIEIKSPIPTRLFYKFRQIICQQNIDGIWLTRIPLNTTEQQELGLYNPPTILNHVAKILSDADSNLWYDELSGKSFLYRHGNKVFEITSSGDILKFVSAPPNLSRFEDPNFIIGKENSFYLARYGFSIENGTIVGTKLQITESEPLLPQNTAQLYCQHRENGQQFCRVPIQAFYLDPAQQTKKTGHFAELTHDIHHHIASNLQQYRSKEKYEHSEQFYEYPIIDGEIQVPNAEMGLYLVYIYLANHDYSKAFMLLNQIEKIGLQGDEREMQHLEWILNKIPYPLPSIESKPIISPRGVACQLKALSLFSGFYNQGLETNLSPPLSLPQTIQEEHKKRIQTDCDQLSKQFSSTLANKIIEYQKHLRHLDVQFTLSDDELLSMTRYLQSSAYPFIGSLDYLHQTLVLKQLYKEIKQLQGLTPTPEIQARINALQEAAKQPVQIRKNSTQLTEKNIPLDFYLTRDLFDIRDISHYDIYTSWRYSDLLTLSPNRAEAIATLKPNMAYDDFILHFPAYAQIAYEKNTASPDYQKLRAFLIQLIKSQYHTDVSKQKNAFLAWILFLYKLSDQNFKFTGSTLSIKDVCEYQMSEPLEPVSVEITEDFITHELIDASAFIPMEAAGHAKELGIMRYTIPKEYDFKTLRTLARLNDFALQVDRANADLKMILKHCKTEDDAGEVFLIHKAFLESIDFSTAQKSAIRQANLALLEAIEVKLGDWSVLIESIKLNLDEGHQVKIFAELAQAINKDDLIRCYYQNSLTAYQEYLGKNFSSEEIMAIHQQVHQLMHLEISKQQSIRLTQALEQNDNLAIVNVLAEDNLAAQDPSLMVFQYKSGIILRPQQTEALKSLLDNSEFSTESVKKITMGGGKSKVLLELLHNLLKAQNYKLILRFNLEAHMIPTIRLYMTNPEQLMSEALVHEILDENHRKVLVLDKTPFYPQGGGQPYDKGVIESSNAFFEVEEVRAIDDCVKHYGQFIRGHFTPNQSVYCKVDAKRRHQHNCLHSAGHVVDMAVFKLGLNWTPEKGHHFPDNSYVEYSGTLENLDKEQLKESIETTCNKLIQEDHKTSIRFVSHAELKHLCHFLPSYISEEDQKIRLVVFGEDFYIPCGGTHVQALSEIPKITVRKIKMEKGKVRVSYAMMNE